MRVLFATHAERTHFYSMIPLAWALRTAGHEVYVASQPALTEDITRAGLTAVPVGEDHRFLQQLEQAGGTADYSGGFGQDGSIESPETWEGQGLLYRAFIDLYMRGVNNDAFVEGLVDLARHFRPDLVVWERRLEPCVETIPELADRLLPLVLHEADRPLALFGHSMGAFLAFELAGLLEQRAGMVPTMLFASGRRAPSRFRPEDDVHRRGDEALLAGTDTRVLGDDEMLRMILPALRDDYRAAELYRPARIHQVTCPVTALVGTTDPKAPLDDVRAWQEHTTGPFTLRTYPGGHFYLVDQAPQVLTLLTEILTTAGPEATDSAGAAPLTPSPTPEASARS